MQREGNGGSSSSLKWVLALPPALLLLGGAMMLVASPVAWGAASDFGQPAWTTTFSGLLVAVPAFVVGGLALRETRRRTRNDFTVALVPVAVAFAFVAVVALGVLVLATRIADPGTYESLQPQTPQDDPFSPAAFVTITIVGTGTIGMVTAGIAYLLCQSIIEEGSPRFRRRADERDALGEIIEESRTVRTIAAPRDGGLLDELGYAVKTYWSWTKRGPSHLLAGLGLPLMVPLLFVGLSRLPAALSSDPDTYIIYVTGNLRPGVDVTLTAAAAPGAICSVVLTSPSGNSFTPAGLEPKMADDSGRTTWHWQLDTDIETGRTRFDVVCDREKAGITIDIAKPRA
jgi:hypothetical protein